VCLDDWVGELPGRSAHLIKVDVEGAEEEVFAGARGVLSRQDGPALLFESFKVAQISELLAKAGYEVRRVHYSLGMGLTFPRVDEAFDDLYAAYEPPNYVALKTGGQFPSFEEISLRSKRRVTTLSRLLSALA
jgi:hypothetical protein